MAIPRAQPGSPIHMMRWLQRLGPESKNLEGIHRRFLEMIVDGRHAFDAAANALLGGTDPEVIRRDLFSTDERINRTEQEIRRAIVVHGTVHGASTFPDLLILMSLVKDAERVGDYAKNLYDIAVDQPRFDPAELAALVELKDKISKVVVRAHGLHEKHDTPGARALLDEIDRMEDDCDAKVREFVKATGENRTAAALTYRYFKRVLGHIGNIVSSLVVPLDKLDYRDEPKPRQK